MTGTIASAFSWSTVPDDPWSTEALWTSALVLALTAISLATQQTIGLSRLSSCEKGWQKIRRLLGEQNPYYGTRSMRRSFGRLRRYTESRVRIKKSQLWIWQTPVMLSNFAILLFVIGLMISIFVRAVRLRGDWSQGRIQVILFPPGHFPLLKPNVLFYLDCHLLRLRNNIRWCKLPVLLACVESRLSRI